MTPPIALRGKTDHDIARVFSDWLKSARSWPVFAQIPNETYFWNQHRVIEALWVDPTVLFVVACSPDDPTKIYGWLAGQRADTLAGDVPVVHFTYVSKLYRRMGVASVLLAAFDQRADKNLPLVVTSISPAGRELLGNQPWIYNPFILWARTPLPGPGVKVPAARTGRRSKFKDSRRDVAVAGFSREPGETEP